MKKLFCLALGCLALANFVSGQLSLITTGNNYLIDFDGTIGGISNGAFAGTGFQPAPNAGQLDSDGWELTGFSDGDLNFGGTNTTGDYARGSSTGGVSTGGIYAFDRGGGNIILGFQPGGSDFTPGTLTLRISNNTGGIINSIDVTYDIWVFNNEDRSSSFNLSYSSDNINFTGVGALDYNTPEAQDASPSWTSTNRTTTITGISIPNGSFFYLRWSSDDVSGSGSRDEFGIDDIVLNATTGGCPAPGDIIITEIMYNPSTSEPLNEWIEVYNPTGSAIDIDGWELADNSFTHTISHVGPLWVPAGGYLVLGRGPNIGCLGSAPDYQYTSLSLGNSGDEIVLRCSGTTIDSVDYSASGFPNAGDGNSLTLDDETNQTAATNDNGANWCASDSLCPSGTDNGTPGLQNENCCRIDASGFLTYCDDNGTPGNSSDDTYLFTLDPSASGNAATYSFTGSSTSGANIAYGTESNYFGPLSIGLNETITIIDDSDNSCRLTASVISSPPHCSYNSAGITLESQFVNPCGEEGPNEFAIFSTGSNPVDIDDLALGSGRHFSDLTHVWLGGNYATPGDIPGSSSTESCSFDVQCYTWLTPSIPAHQTIINDVIAELNFVAGCTVFLPVPSTDLIPANAEVVAFLGAGFPCPFGDQDGNGNTGNDTDDAFNNTDPNVNFCSHCTGGCGSASNPATQQYYVVLGTANSCGTFGYFHNNDPRVSFLSDNTGTNSQSYDFNGIEPSIITSTGPVEGGPCVPSPTTLLPVELLEFSASALEKAVLLVWSTLTEINNEYYSIERSADGRQFKAIGQVQGHSTSTGIHHYQFVDPRPEPGINYYRLRQADYDGSYTYSPVRAVSFQTEEVLINLHPTMSSSSIQIHSSKIFGQPVTMEIFNAIGQRLNTFRFDPGSSSFRFDVTALGKGYYFLQIRSGAETYVRRFIRQ